MRMNPLREAIERDSTAVGAWLMSPSSINAEFIGQTGFDYCCVDMQHGLIGYAEALSMLQALSLGGSTATVRVPWNEPGIIGKVLDAGAMAVIVPMTNTAEDAERAVAASMYAPRGSRSSGPIRAQLVEGSGYADVANDQVLVIPMIETVEAVENIDSILATPNVNVIYVGPMDLGVSMGLGRGTTDPSFFETLDHIIERCRANGVTPGIHASPTNVQSMIERGFKMVTAHSDLAALQSAMTSALATARGESTSADTATPY